MTFPLSQTDLPPGPVIAIWKAVCWWSAPVAQAGTILRAHEEVSAFSYARVPNCLGSVTGPHLVAHHAAVIYPVVL